MQNALLVTTSRARLRHSVDPPRHIYIRQTDLLLLLLATAATHNSIYRCHAEQPSSTIDSGTAAAVAHTLTMSVRVVPHVVSSYKEYLSWTPPRVLRVRLTNPALTHHVLLDSGDI